MRKHHLQGVSPQKVRHDSPDKMRCDQEDTGDLESDSKLDEGESGNN